MLISITTTTPPTMPAMNMINAGSSKDVNRVTNASKVKLFPLRDFFKNTFQIATALTHFNNPV